MDIGKFLRTLLLTLLLTAIGYFFILDYFNTFSSINYPNIIIVGIIKFFSICAIVLALAFYFKDRIYLKSFIALGILESAIFSVLYMLFAWAFTIIIIAFMVVFLLNPNKFFADKGLLAYSFFIISISVVLSVFVDSSGVLIYPITVMVFVGFFTYNKFKPTNTKGYVKYLALISLLGFATLLIMNFLQFTTFSFIMVFFLGILPLVLIVFLIYKLYTTAKDGISFDWKLYLISGLIILSLVFVFYPRNAGYYYSFNLPQVPPGKECNCIGVTYSIPGGCDTFVSPLFSTCSAGGLGYMRTKCAGIAYNCHLIEKSGGRPSNSAPS